MPVKPLTIRYEDDLRLFAGRWQRLGLVAAVILVAGYPLAVSGVWLVLAAVALTAVVGSTGLMILTGFTGQISLGHAAFLGLGAYTAAILAGELGWPFWLTMVAGGTVAAASGLAIGPFALRLRGLYLAIVTLGLVFVVQHLLRSFPSSTGGSAGLRVPMYWWFETPGTPTTFGAALNPVAALQFEQQLVYVYAVVATSVVIFTKNLQRSHTGRAMAAVRDRDVAAAVMGVNIARTKVLAFGISSFLAGVAGSMLAYQQRFLTIDPPFNLAMSVEYIAMIVLGGLGTVFGAVAGAVAFVFVGAAAERLLGHLPILNQLTSGQQRILLFSLIVGFFLLYEPLGLYGIWRRIRTYFTTWPFRY